MNRNLYDARAVFQTLGCVIKHPEYIDEYRMTNTDYEVNSFDQLVFSAVHNLYKQNIRVIDCFAIDSLLSRYPAQYEIFCDHNGVKRCAEMANECEIDNFTYYIERVKKFSLLRYLESSGYDVKRIYDWTVTTAKKQTEQSDKFDNMSIEDMLGYVENSLVVESNIRFCTHADSHGQLLGEGITKLIDGIKAAPDVGLPLQSPLYTSLARGMRLRKLYIRSGSTSSGKTRTALADFAHISIPYFYDTEKRKWKYTGFKEPTLFISTELEVDEVQTIVLAYLTGINEEVILMGDYTDEQDKLITQAKEYIKQSYFFVEILPDFTIKDVETLIKKYHHTEGIRYFCFDYVHTSASLITEIATMSKGMKLREDQILFLFVDRLKVLCNSLKVFILTMTQLNGTYKDSPVKDETMLSGSKAMANRIDLGEISLPPTKADLKAVRGIIEASPYNLIPNLVRHIYKLRRGKLSKARIWQRVDLGTGRTVDLFVTDYEYNLIPVTAMEVEIYDEDKRDSKDSNC